MSNPKKMKFETPNLADENIKKLSELFPGVVTEGKVNVDLLRSYVGEEISKDEVYEFTWVGKRAAIAEAGRPIRKTLRPCPEESRDWITKTSILKAITWTCLNSCRKLPRQSKDDLYRPALQHWERLYLPG